jgi:hypothetical protein
MTILNGSKWTKPVIYFPPIIWDELRCCNGVALSKKKSGALWSGIGLCVLTAVEVMDGYSAEWGASWDIIANAAGTALYVSQELIWEQRITPKFSFHTTKYASFRPSVLGSSFQNKFKDYNGQNVLAFH